jgi:hypothetical protein
MLQPSSEGCSLQQQEESKGYNEGSTLERTNTMLEANWDEQLCERQCHRSKALGDLAVWPVCTSLIIRIAQETAHLTPKAEVA